VPFVLSRLWIDLLQIGTGTDWLNSFIKSRKLLIRSCFTSLINARSPCLLVDLGRPVQCSRLIFYIFPLIKSVKKFRHYRSTKSNYLSDFCFFNPSWCSRTTCRFWSGLISFVFLAMFETPFLQRLRFVVRASKSLQHVIFSKLSCLDLVT
jgi:hypothetical protein